jgi:Ca-activated chloride channel family protein
MSFDQPLYLWLLLPALAALGGFFFWAWREKRRLIALFVSARLLPSLTLGVAPERQKTRMMLLVAAVGLLLLALSRPQIGFSWEEARSRGLDIVVAIDTSRSMLATDVAPNRLRRAQLAALDLKRLAKSDRLGLVAFAGGAFLQCPLTLDDEAFRQSVEALDVNIIPQGGTALAEAILAAKSAFKKDNDNHKVLVLFTDGEDHDGEAVAAAKQAGEEGMIIYTIGVGTPNGDVLRTTDVQGRTEFIKGPDGNAVRSQLNETLLQDIAQATRGFYRQLSGANTMNVLYEYGLAPLPKSDLASQKIKRQHERFQWLLGLAIVLLFVEMFVPERKETKRAPTANDVAKAVALVLLLALPATVFAGPGKALKQYGAGKFDAAQLEYERALKSKPDDPRLHFNAGAAAFQAKDYDTALGHLNSALLAQEVPLQQRAYYNLGNTRFRLGEDAGKPDEKKTHWEQAVKGYESALKLDPKDEDARHNLDFVKQRLEELKQQQQQQKDDKNQQDQKDQKDQDQKGDQNKDQKDQQKQDQQKQDQQKQDQEKQQQDQKKQDEQKKQEEQQASKPDKKDGEDKKGQEASEDQNKEEGDDEKDGAPQGAKVIKMTPQQAMQLLDTLKAEEKNFPLRPILRTNKHERVFKDW